MTKLIYLFGDSIVKGTGDLEMGGWGSRLRNFFENNDYNTEVRNFGVGGNTTDDLLRRFAIESESGVIDIVIFGIGINDSKRIGNNSVECIVTIERIRENLRELIRLAKQKTDKIIFLGLTSVDETKTCACIWDGIKSDVFFYNKDIELHNSVIEEMVAINKKMI
jgi:lysophospholipase L1-like esterase